jgi:5-methylcytosine-specific restriction enzyme A
MPRRPVTYKPPKVRQSPIAKVGGRDRPTTTERGYDSVWERVRALHLKEFPFCVDCRPRLVAAREVDHKIPIAQRPDLRLDGDNLQSLCKHHHSRKTRREQNEARRPITVRPA